MTRITNTQSLRTVIALIQKSRSEVERFGQEVSSGVRVARPGDDAGSAPTIANLRETVERFEKHKFRIQNVGSSLSLQNDVLTQANDILIRAKELATQGANEVLGPQLRQSLSDEVFQLRDALVSLANTQYQGRYIYSGAADNQPAYSVGTPAYTNYGTTAASQRYVYNSNAGSTVSNSVSVSDDTTIGVNTPGNQVFDSAIQSLEILGRALQGYDSTLTGNVPDGGGAAYVFPQDLSQQTTDILAAMDRVDAARQGAIAREQVSIGARQARLDNAQAVLDSLQANLKEVLSKTQGADAFESAANLSEAQTALQSSLLVSSSLLKISLLDYI